jgi:ABC-2 family transporter protein
MTGLLWRQHRGQALWTLLTLAALCALMVGVRLSVEHWFTGYQHWLAELAAAGCPPPDAHGGTFHVPSAATCIALRDRYPGSLQAAFTAKYNFAIPVFQYGIPAALAAIGVILGAPLVAREIEQRTQLTAWTQSVSRRRWYATKVAALVAGLAVVGLVAGYANAWLQRPLTEGGLTSTRWSWFFSINLASVGEAVLAFALAVALGAWLRRTVPAIGGGLVGFLALLLAARWTVRTLTSVAHTTGPKFAVPANGWIIRTQTGHSVPYHPASQYWPLQLTFLTIMLALTAAALASGWYATRTRAV